MMDIHKFKPLLLEYLKLKNINIIKNGRTNTARCISPSHVDNNPSMSIYDEYANCNSCSFKGDIFDCAGIFINDTKFNNQLKEIRYVLGDLNPTLKKIKNIKNIKSIINIPLTHKDALKVYTEKKILEYSNFLFNTDKDNNKIPIKSEKYRKLSLIKFYPYYDEDGMIDLMVARLEDQCSKKEVLSFYFDGKNLKMKGYPTLIYGRDLIKSKKNKKIIIHEGEKCCDIANEKISDFINITWNGGGNKFKKVDWSILKERKIYILGDDDVPGQKIANRLKEFLKQKYQTDSILIPVFKKARKIKKKGADIVEILQCYNPDEIKKIILNKYEKDNTDCNSNNISICTLSSNASDSNNSIPCNSEGNNGCSDSSDNNEYPFKILGIASDGQAYFIDYEGFVKSHELTSLNEKKLIDLAGLQFFKSGTYPSKNEWLTEIDTIMRLSKKTYFEIDNLRGRGAWKDSNDNICYNDGKATIGRYDPSWTFVRKPIRTIGIGKPDASPEKRARIMNICKQFSFKTHQDCIRFMSWSILAPFSGALTWRPSILVSGESGSGKSTLIDSVLRPISLSLAVNGAQTTEAGIRQHCGIDSGGVSIDEFDAKKQRDKERLDDILSLMRGSTTDDAPMTLKGTSSGSAMSFKMRSMFCFAAVNASIDRVENDNRIIRIDFIKLNNFKIYVKCLREIKKILTPETCKKIRSVTWRNLKKIINLSKRLEFVIQEVTGQDSRYALCESILLAANMVIWENREQEIDDNFLNKYCCDFYKNLEKEDKRNETKEMVERLLDETILIDELKERHSIRSILIEMKKFKDNESGITNNQSPMDFNRYHYKIYKKTVEQYGVTIHGPTNELAIAQNHYKIMRILNIEKGYHRQLIRHENVIEYGTGKTSVSVSMDGASKRATIISGFLKYDKDL